MTNRTKSIATVALTVAALAAGYLAFPPLGTPKFKYLPPQHLRMWSYGPLDGTEHAADEHVHLVDTVEGFIDATDSIAVRGYGTIMLQQDVDASGRRLLLPGGARLTLTSNCHCVLKVTEPVQIVDSAVIYQFMREIEAEEGGR